MTLNPGHRYVTGRYLSLAARRQALALKPLSVTVNQWLRGRYWHLTKKGMLDMRYYRRGVK